VEKPTKVKQDVWTIIEELAEKTSERVGLTEIIIAPNTEMPMNENKELFLVGKRVVVTIPPCDEKDSIDFPCGTVPESSRGENR
jgi:hypothetical protein